jgi:hypothetical protein
MVPGPCDEFQKGCCLNIATEVRYCAQSEGEQLSCNMAPVGDEFSLRCQYCGQKDQPCCFPSSLDAEIAKPWDIAMAPPACRSADLACMLDRGSADHFAK